MANRRGIEFGALQQSTFVPSIAQLVNRLRLPADEPIRYPVRRPDDLLVFDLLFDNLEVVPDLEQGPVLRRTDPEKAGILIVEFPPQSFGEEAFLGGNSPTDTTSDDIVDEGVAPGITATKVTQPLQPAKDIPAIDLVRVRMAGASRVAFVMDPAISEITFTLAAILDAMRDWAMNLDSNALPDVPDTQSRLVVQKNLSNTLRRALLNQVIELRTVDLNNTLAKAVQRITHESVGGLTTTGRPQLGEVMWKGVLREAELLFDQHPDLREGDAHLATLATLAFESAGNLTEAAQQLNFEFDTISALEELPWVSFLTGFPHEPAQQVTALELPYRLVLTPIESARWRHRILPRVAQGLTELWHTRLTTSTGQDHTDAAAKVRAIWSPDYLLDDTQIVNKVNKPFRMSLDTQDRKMLVNLMGNYRQRRGDIPRFKYIPAASVTKRLQLSALGGLLDLEGEWGLRPEGVDLEQWRHLATLGRDHYVRVVYSGFLLPFGHAASLVKVTERTFDGEPGSRIAVLRQRYFIVVRERARKYDGSKHVYDGRNFPFTEIEILTRITPDLASPVKGIDGNGISDRMAFWPQVLAANTPLRFEVSALDRDNQRVSFSLPMLFVSEIVNRKYPDPVKLAYNIKQPIQTYREADLRGVSIRFDKESGNSTLSAHVMSFKLGSCKTNSTTEANFHPEMEVVSVGVHAIQKLLGSNSLIEMQYPKEVIEKSPGNNEGQVFLVVLENKSHTLNFGGGGNAQQTDSLGGLAAPQMEIYGLSKLSGPVASQKGLPLATALTNSLNNHFNPADYFASDAKLIGGITLGELFKSLPIGPLNGSAAPRYISTQVGDTVTTRFDWATEIRDSDSVKLLIPSGDTWLHMQGETLVSITNTQAPTRSAKAMLEKFKLNLFGCIILNFDKLAFTANPGQKPDVSVQLNKDSAVRFGGPLEFVNDLRKFIPSNGFSDPPALSVTPSGISASYSLGLPTIGVGIFSLSNVTLGAGFNLPFDNRPVSVRFNFAERQRPFSLTVSLLGGGGFFAATVGAKGIQEIEAALEFGAAISLNLVVASGMVEIKAGVYFNWKDDIDGKRTVLAGYVRIHGELTIVAIFSASLTFNLQLGYDTQTVGGKKLSVVYGEAELIVEVEVVFFSFSVPVRCRKEFGGGEADPKFIDLMDEHSWTDYCAAFAPEVV